MRSSFDQYRAAGFTAIYLTAAHLAGPSECPCSCWQSEVTMQGAPLRDKVSVQKRVSQQRHSAHYRAASGMCCDPLNCFHTELSRKKSAALGGGWWHRITPSVITMALLTNRIGVIKPELFLGDVERCPIGRLG